MSCTRSLSVNWNPSSRFWHLPPDPTPPNFGPVPEPEPPLTRVPPDYQLNSWCSRCNRPAYISRYPKEEQHTLVVTCSCHGAIKTPPSQTTVRQLARS